MQFSTACYADNNRQILILCGLAQTFVGIMNQEQVDACQ